MGREGDDRDMTQLWVGPEAASGAPAIGARHPHVHEDKVGHFHDGQGQTLFGVLRRQNLVAFFLQPARHQDAVVFGVFNV